MFEHEVVGAAEDVVSEAWRARLNSLCGNATRLLDASRKAHEAARRRVHEASADEEPGSADRARVVFEQVERACADNRVLSCAVLAFVQQQLAALDQAQAMPAM
ncbi:MAG TPA: hypothetical protein VH372_16620 [Actinospica sp.]|jgi:hypothetical protein|nr:hypothetical protein [Actinospica sp.]